MPKITANIDDGLLAELTAEAERLHRSIDDVLTEVLAEWLEDRELLPQIREARAEYRAQGGVEADEFFRELEAEDDRAV